MNYNETLDYLYSRLPMYQRLGSSAYKEGLDNSLALDRYLDFPHRKYKTIHVGGTNGKGSTSHTLSAILQSAGYKVGLYTSPHLTDFRERIRVNGEMIGKEYVTNFVERHREFTEALSPSFFELTMMMAFCYFADSEVDVAVIEVGLGGRLDSTNIIRPDVSVITNISFDHVQFLGDTLPKIAAEKAGIIKPGVPVVVGEAGEEIRSVFVEKAKQENASIVFTEDENPILSAVTGNDGGWFYQTGRFGSFRGELGGYCQEKNAATILKTIEVLIQLGYRIDNEAVVNGFDRVVQLTGLCGRWQILGNSPRIICDTGHNEAGIEYIVKQLSQQQYEKLHVVFGVVNDKDINKILALLPKHAHYYFTRADIPRALPGDELCQKAIVYNLKGDTFPDVAKAIAQARNNASANDLIFIGGSTFVVADALKSYSEFGNY